MRNTLVIRHANIVQVVYDIGVWNGTASHAANQCLEFILHLQIEHTHWHLHPLGFEYHVVRSVSAHCPAEHVERHCVVFRHFFEFRQNHISARQNVCRIIDVDFASIHIAFKEFLERCSRKSIRAFYVCGARRKFAVGCGAHSQIEFRCRPLLFQGGAQAVKVFAFELVLRVPCGPLRNSPSGQRTGNDDVEFFGCISLEFFVRTFLDNVEALPVQAIHFRNEQRTVVRVNKFHAFLRVQPQHCGAFCVVKQVNHFMQNCVGEQHAVNHRRFVNVEGVNWFAANPVQFGHTPNRSVGRFAEFHNRAHVVEIRAVEIVIQQRDHFVFRLEHHVRRIVWIGHYTQRFFTGTLKGAALFQCQFERDF
ncbi:hypothetical protein D3C80_535110 [compost metagenome]